MKNFSRRHKGLLIALSVVLLLSCVFTADYLGNWGVFSAKAAATDYSNIRVYLTTMNGQTSVPFTVTGKYSISGITGDYSFRNGVMLRENVTYTLKAVNGNVVLSFDGNDYVLGSDVTFYSHLAGRNYYLTVNKNPKYGKCNYIGNMRVYVSGGTLAFINTLQLDDYLCGVIAYEMSNGQAVESLKVQAVCARSYAYNIVCKRTKYEYDVVDTNSNQTYKGFNPSYTNCIKAVDETAYQVLTYKGSCIQTFYSASNGGITENNNNVWGSTKLPYFNVNIDEYDKSYRNVVYTLSKTNVVSNNVTTFKNKLKKELEAAGYDMNTFSVVSINSIVPTYESEPTSLDESDRRVYSVLYGLTVKIKKTGSDTEETLDKTVTLLRENARTGIYVTNTSGTSRYLPSTKYKVYENDDSFTFIVDGNGHGIGMSQVGTYARVKAGQTYTEILDFYFNGTVLKTLQFEPYIYEPIPSNSYLDTQASSIKVLETTKIGKTNASVYLYSNAGAIYERTVLLENEKGVTVVSETEGWYGVVVGDNEYTGFIMKDFVDVEENVVIENIVGVYDLGVTTGEVSIRAEADFESDIIGTYAKNTQVAIVATKNGFFEIIYNGESAYVPITEVELTGVKSYVLFNSKTVAYKTPIFENNGENGKKIGYLFNGSELQIFDVSSENEYYQCIYNGTYAYVKKTDVAFDNVSVGFVVPENNMQVALNVKITSDMGIYSSTEFNEEERIGELVKGDIVKVIAKVNDAYRIVFGNNDAYISVENTLEYSKSIIKIIAQAKSDMLLYSDEKLTTPAGFIQINEKAVVVGEINGILMIRYDSAIYYVSRSSMNVQYNEIYIFG